MAAFALGVAALSGLGWYAARTRADRRWRALLDRYAEHEAATAADSAGNLIQVLHCRQGERFVMPTLSLTVSVLAVEGNAVRLGIAAAAEDSAIRAEPFPQHNSVAGHQTFGDRGGDAMSVRRCERTSE